MRFDFRGLNPMRSRMEESMETHAQHEGWKLRESGPASADQAVLLLPGALCTAAFYDDVLAVPKLSAASIRFVAATLPGHGRTEPPDDLGLENYARLAGKLAADFGCDGVVGHSLGANVALEMAAAGHFSGPLVLLSPSFSRTDESKFPRALDRMSIALGHLPYTAMLKVIGPAMKGSLPPERQDALIAELKKNDPRFLRRQTRRYLEYLDRHGSLVSRLCDSGVKAWVVFGERDDIGLTDDERRALEECPHVTLITIPDAGHFTLNEKPDRIAELIVGMLSANAAP
jgi:pimeloyl-ACP methyl ester carboxylesterase